MLEDPAHHGPALAGLRAISVSVKEVIPITETALITAIVGVLSLMLSFGTLILKIVELVVRSK